MGGATAGGGWGALIGGVLGAGAGALSFIGKDLREAQEQGGVVTLEEALKITKANKAALEEAKDTAGAAKLDDAIKKLQEAYDTLTAKTEEIRTEYTAQLGSVTTAIGKTKSYGIANINMMKDIAASVASGLTLEQMADESVYQQIVGDIATIMNKLSSGELNLSGLSGKIGTDYFTLIADNKDILTKINAAISANSVQLGNATGTLKKKAEDLVKSLDTNAVAIEKRSELYTSLATLGSNADMSKGDIFSLLGINARGERVGGVNVSKIIDPALKKYAQELSDLYEEYWGENGKISSASLLEDTETLTAEYERQVEIKQKEYEILQKQLEVQEAQNALDEASRERTTLVFRNGRFMYEADPGAMQNLQETQEAARKELDSLEIEKAIMENSTAQKNSAEKIATGMDKIIELLEDVTQHTVEWAEISKMIEDDLKDGYLDDELLKTFYDLFGGLDEEAKAALYKAGIFVKRDEKGGILKDEKGNVIPLDIKTRSGISSATVGGTAGLTGGYSGYGSASVNIDNIHRDAATNAAQVSSSVMSSIIGDNYNIAEINVTEAENLEGIITSAKQQIATQNAKIANK